jgi:hypothetical protein
MKCKDKLEDILNHLDEQADSIEQEVDTRNQCLKLLKQIEPECSGTFVQTVQEFLSQNEPLDGQAERKLQLILWAISNDNKSTVIGLASAALNSNKTRHKEKYVDILDSLEDPRTIPSLMSAIELDSSVGYWGGMARYKAINGLLMLEAQEAKSLIIPCVKDPVYRVRHAAIRFLVDLDICQAAPVFIEQLKQEEDPDNLELLIEGIVSWQQTDALPVLRDILASEWAKNDEYVGEVVEDAILDLEEIEKPSVL